jgi:hypothetical protein
LFIGLWICQEDIPAEASNPNKINTKIINTQSCIIPENFYSTLELLKKENLELKRKNVALQTAKVVYTKRNEKYLKQMRKFKPFIKPLLKYHNNFDLTKENFENFLLGILYNETGGQARFIPKYPAQKYLETGDGGYGCHAWQLDRRYHSFCKPMSFEKSGKYAIKKVLLPCYKRASKKGLKGWFALKSTATCYNSGRLNDKYSTNYYGKRVMAFMELNQSKI